MRRREIDMHRLQELVHLHRKDVGARERARLLKMGPNQERKYREALQEAGLLDGPVDSLPELEELKAAVQAHLGEPAPPKQEESSVEPYRSDIARMLKRNVGPKAIHDWLSLHQEGFEGSLSAVKRMCLRIRKEWGPQPEDVVIRVETEPGEIAQVDFGYVGHLLDEATGLMRKAYAFVMVLCFSRLMYVDFVFDQSVATWVGQHQKAFEFFGGVPSTVVPDNLKSAVVRCYFDLTEKPELNRTYREFARHYGFKVDPTPPYSPEKKGKVESNVKYVKGNFVATNDSEEMEESRRFLRRWRDEIANVRKHGTTGQVPRELFEKEERAALSSLPTVGYNPVEWKHATVSRDCHVAFERRLYSVPFRLIEQKVWIRAERDVVRIYADDAEVARHERRGRGAATNDAHLPEGRAELRHRDEAWWRQKAAAIGETVAEYVDEVFQSDDVCSQLRTVVSIIGLLEKYPSERAESACRRARLFGNYTYKGLRKILEEGIDLEPAFPTAVYVHGRLEQPRYARTADELLQRKEVNHGN